jgi:hypothetical protein
MKDEIRGTCSTYESVKKCMHNLSSNIWSDVTTSGVLGADASIILKWTESSRIRVSFRSSWRFYSKKNIDFLDITHRHVFYLKQHFGKWIVAAFSGKTPNHVAQSIEPVPISGPRIWEWSRDPRGFGYTRVIRITTQSLSYSNWKSGYFRIPYQSARLCDIKWIMAVWIMQGICSKESFCDLTLQRPVVTIYTICFNIPELCILFTQCICVFRMVLTINSDCFPKQH